MNANNEKLAEQIRRLLTDAEAKGQAGSVDFEEIMNRASEGLGLSLTQKRYSIIQDFDRDVEVFPLEYGTLLLQQICVSWEAEQYDAVSFNITGMTIINNRFGTDNGTKIMRAYLRYLNELVGEEGVVARIGGDTFFAVYDRKLREQVIAFVRGMDVKVPEVTDHTVHLSSIAGFIEIDAGQDASTILDAINAVRRIAKFRPNTTYLFYDDEIQKRLQNERQVELMFPTALEAEEFEIFYQPKVELRRYHLSGAEALCRWFHDGRRMMPDDFIPVLERNGAICDLDFYVLEHVCRDIREWIDDGRQAVCVSVNLSRCNLGDPELLDRIVGTIRRYDLPAGAVEIEITETATEVSFRELQKLVTGLREEGISCSLDDFGAGFSSMSTLSEIPWSVIKIDRSLVPVGDGEPEDDKRKILIRSIVSMAESLGISCITEGVETLRQSIFLKSIDCYLAQGFFFDKPMGKEEFEKRLLAERVQE